MEALSIILGVLGSSATIAVVFNYARSHFPTRKFCGLQWSTPLDVIVTTSATTRSTTGASVQRPTTGIGQVQGASHLSKFLGRFYKRKPIEIHLGKTLALRPSGDLVLLGGPSKNQYSELFIEKLKEAHPMLELDFNDIESFVSIKKNIYNIHHLQIERGMPKKDIGVVISWRNPFSPAPEKTRAIFCAGLTSYGTSGAALWYFDDLLTRHSNFRWLRRKVGRSSPNFICVVNVEVINGATAGVEILDVYII